MEQLDYNILYRWFGLAWQNDVAERLVGSIRRECVYYFIVLGEAHLRRILPAYARYYNDTRTRQPLDKDAPISRPVRRTGILQNTIRDEISL
jgi:transposase InsO family protein